MANLTHTAGTWTAEHDFSGGIAIVSSHRRIHVAHVNKHAGMIEEDTANANLICAAPTMLAGLRAAESAIAGTLDARGYRDGDDLDTWAHIVRAEVAALATIRTAIRAAEGRA